MVIVSLVVEGDRLAGEVEVQGRYVGEGAAPGGTPITLHYVVLTGFDKVRDDGSRVAEKIPRT